MHRWVPGRRVLWLSLRRPDQCWSSSITVETYDRYSPGVFAGFTYSGLTFTDGASPADVTLTPSSISGFSPPMFGD